MKNIPGPLRDLKRPRRNTTALSHGSAILIEAEIIRATTNATAEIITVCVASETVYTLYAQPSPAPKIITNINPANKLLLLIKNLLVDLVRYYILNKSKNIKFIKSCFIYYPI